MNSDRRPFSPRRAVVAVAAVVMAALVVFAAAALVPGPDRSGDSVVILGDSITALGEKSLVATLGGSYDLFVSGNFGARIGDVVGDAEALAATEPDQVVVNLGTNDVVVGTPIDLAAASMDSVLSALDEVECVHVVTVGENLPSDGVALPRQAALVNAIIAESVGQHPNAQLVHWDRAQSAAAIRRDDPAALTTDGVHPDSEGQAVLTEAYADVLSGCGRPWFLP